MKADHKHNDNLGEFPLLSRIPKKHPDEPGQDYFDSLEGRVMNRIREDAQAGQTGGVPKWIPAMVAIAASVLLLLYFGNKSLQPSATTDLNKFVQNISGERLIQEVDLRDMDVDDILRSMGAEDFNFVPRLDSIPESLREEILNDIDPSDLYNL